MFKFAQDRLNPRKIHGGAHGGGYGGAFVGVDKMRGKLTAEGRYSLIVKISSNGFFIFATVGILASSLGWPAAMIINGFS